MSSTRLAGVLVDELVRGGVREVVLAPGSRNAPLAFALTAAEQAGALRLHVRIDERSAAFLALGLARGSGRPVAVTCTSGTAVANLHPAMIEASLSGVPLIALTADRPGVLVGTGANQTVDQRTLFGTAPRLTTTLTALDDEPAVRSWVDRALAAAAGVGGRRGPVHLNAEFTEPLVPDVGALPRIGGRPDGAPWTTVEQETTRARLAVAGRTLVVVGEGPDELTGSAVAAATELGLPCHVEAGSALGRAGGTLRAGGWLLGIDEFVAAHRPEQIVVVGRPTLGRSLGRVVRSSRTRVTVIDDRPDWTDPNFVAASYHRADAIELTGTADEPWAQAWRAADIRAATAVEAWDAAGAVLRPGAVARAVLAAAPQLLLGSSNPVRDADLHRPAILPGRVWANRGAAGIDGLVSTAAGIALAAGPTVALLGDLAFVHDSNGLVRGPLEPEPDLTIVVVNNDGGAIFHLLEQGGEEYRDQFERVFGTPHGTDLDALCAAVGVPHRRVDSAAELTHALASTPAGTQVLEVTVDRQGDRAERDELSGAVGAAVLERD